MRTLALLSPLILTVLAFGQGGGPGGGSSGQHIGGDWYIVESENRTIDTVDVWSIVNGVEVHTTYTRDNSNDGGGVWYQNGVPIPTVSEPVGSNYRAEWKVSGTYYVRYEYQGQGTCPDEVPIVVWSNAQAHWNLVSPTDGGYGVATNSFGKQADSGDPTLYLAGCNNVLLSNSGELLYAHPADNGFEYETPVATAEAYSRSNSAAAYASISNSVQLSTRSISAAQNPNPIWKAIFDNKIPVTLTFSNSSHTTSVNVDNYIPTPFLPSKVSTKSFEISYLIGRPLQKKKMTFYLFGDSQDWDPLVPMPYDLQYLGSASLMGTANSPDSSSWNASNLSLYPPTMSDPGVLIEHAPDYILHEETYTVAGAKNVIAA